MISQLNSMIVLGVRDFHTKGVMAKTTSNRTSAQHTHTLTHHSVYDDECFCTIYSMRTSVAHYETKSMDSLATAGRFLSERAETDHS